MSYKPKYLFLFRSEEDLEKLFFNFQFREENMITKKFSQSCGEGVIDYEHYTLMLKRVGRISAGSLMNQRGIKVCKVIIAKEVYEDIRNNQPDILHDVLEPITSPLKISGDNSIIILK